MAICLTYAKKGDRMLSVSPSNGGYPRFSKRGLGGILGLKNDYFPARAERSSKLAETLQRGIIIVDSGIRLGTVEATRRGGRKKRCGLLLSSSLRE